MVVRLACFYQTLSRETRLSQCDIYYCGGWTPTDSCCSCRGGCVSDRIPVLRGRRCRRRRLLCFLSNSGRHCRPDLSCFRLLQTPATPIAAVAIADRLLRNVYALAHDPTGRLTPWRSDEADRQFAAFDYDCKSPAQLPRLEWHMQQQRRSGKQQP